MITSFFFNIIVLIINGITGFLQYLTLNLHLPIAAFSDDIAYFLSGIWYFNGVFPVQSFLNLITGVIGFEFVMLVIGFFEWIWSKLPFMSK